MAINHAAAGVVGDVTQMVPGTAPAAAPAAAPQQRRRIDELGDAFTATAPSDLRVDPGLPPELPTTGDVNGTSDATSDLIKPNTGEDTETVQANDNALNGPTGPELPPDVAEKLAKYESPELAEEQMDRLVLVPREGGHQELISIDQLRKENMMHADYSQKTMALADIRKQYESGIQGQDRLIAALSDGSSFEGAIEDLAQYEPKVALAWEAAVKRKVEQEIQDFEAAGRSHEILARIKAGRQAERERDRYRRQLEQRENAERQQAEQRAAAQRPDVAALGRQLDQLVPRAFAKIDLVDGDFQRKMLGSHISVFWKDRSKPLTYAIVEQAAMALKQDLTKQFGAGAVKRQPTPQLETPRQPARVPAAAPAGGGKRTQKRIDELGQDWWERG